MKIKSIFKWTAKKFAKLRLMFRLYFMLGSVMKEESIKWQKRYEDKMKNNNTGL